MKIFSPKHIKASAYTFLHSLLIGTAILEPGQLIAQTCPPLAATLSSDQNYIATYSLRIPVISPYEVTNKNICEVNLTVQYFDGLGRSRQLVQTKASPGQKDIIQPIEYDAYGREVKQYLPYADTFGGTAGSYRASATSNQSSFYSPVTGTVPGVIRTGMPFAEKVLELSALGRVKEQGAPGEVWQPGGGHTLRTDYLTNTDTEVPLWVLSPGTPGASWSTKYLADQLYKTITKDENWTNGKAGTVEQFQDKYGRVILKRAWENETASLSTYYVYDDLGNLHYVIPPSVSASSFTESASDVPFSQFIYAYHYDSRNRVVEKKIPGKGWEYIVYNKLDQVVVTQDALQRPSNQWTFTKYDGLGRVIMTGITVFPMNRMICQSVVDGNINKWELRDNSNATGTGTGYTNSAFPAYANVSTYLSINYYDDYAFLGRPAVSPYNLSSYSAMTRGLLTATKVNVLGTAHMLWNVNYYDNDARLVRAIQQHYKGASTAVNNYDDIATTYSFIDEVLTSTRKHYVGGTESLYAANRYLYDHVGRKTHSYQKTGDVSGTTNAEVLLTEVSYNEIGQLYTQGLHSTDGGATFAQALTSSYNARGWLKSSSADLFSLSLKYEDGSIPQYNGNISDQSWGASLPNQNTFSYTYDKLNRLLNGAASGISESVSYDLMGNINTLQRQYASTVVDQLQYTYSGNTLTAVVDGNSSADASYQLAGTTNYAYDVNGNLTSRNNATNTVNNISSIIYNYLNLPQSMTAGGTSVTYTYDAGGRKLRKQTGTGLVYDYVAGIRYEGGILQDMPTEAGRVVRISATNYSYEYTLKDHLGNNRISFDISNGIARQIQKDDYYPYGLNITGPRFGTENRYLYNGKELQEETGFYDFGARMYDPVIGRFNVIDRFAEKYDAINPYQYGGLSPVMNNDINGDSLMLFKNGVYSSTVDNGKAEMTGFNQESKMKKGKEVFTGGQSFSFNDIELDQAGLKSGDVTLDFVSQKEVSGIMKNSEVEKQGPISRWGFAATESNMLNERGTGKMDYLSKVQQGKLSIINGVGYNSNDAGNYLWGYAMGSMGYTSIMARTAAHMNAWYSAKLSNPGMASNHPNPVLRWIENRSWTGDATADQRAIQNGLNDSGSYWKSKLRSISP